MCRSPPRRPPYGSIPPRLLRLISGSVGAATAISHARDLDPSAQGTTVRTRFILLPVSDNEEVRDHAAARQWRIGDPNDPNTLRWNQLVSGAARAGIVVVGKRPEHAPMESTGSRRGSGRSRGRWKTTRTHSDGINWFAARLGPA
jgi:hypothetical protein